jgi:hypothetical protein
MSQFLLQIALLIVSDSRGTIELKLVDVLMAVNYYFATLVFYRGDIQKYPFMLIRESFFLKKNIYLLYSISRKERT